MRISGALAFVLFPVLILPHTSGPASTSRVKNAEKGVPHVVFIRQFSSGQDVKHQHPILDRSLDIIAGPKDPEPHNYALQDPYAVTTDSKHRVFVTDVRAEAVHIFDFAGSTYSRLRGGAGLHLPVGDRRRY